MKTSNLIVLTLIAIAVAVVAFMKLEHRDTSAVPADASPATVALTVSETTATEEKWPDIVKATGPVVAWEEAIIGAEISGQRVIAVKANVGDAVKKGDLLAQINNEMLSAEYEELKANWIAAESNHKRALALKGSGAMSDQVIDDYVNRAAVAKAKMRAKALQLTNTNVVAPDDGVISSRTATLGAVASAGDELFRLIRQSRLEWHGELTADQVARVLPRQSVSLVLPDGTTAMGSIRQVAPSFDPDTRMIRVFADIEADSGARAGMYAAGHVIVGQQLSLSVPAKCVVIRDGRDYVFVLRNEQAGTRVNRQEVQIGHIEGNKTQILSGISQTDRIVLKGAGFLNDGDVVRVSSGKGDKE